MITEGQLRLISRYYAGRGREFAFLELAQEHFLLGPSADHRSGDVAAAVRDRACSRNARHSAPLSS